MSALQGILTQATRAVDPADTATEALEYADALIAALDAE